MKEPLATPSEPFVHSGAPGNAWLLPIVGVASAAVAAFLYAWVNVYSPIAGYVTLLFVAGLAFGAVWPVAKAGVWLKVRSPLQMRIAGAVTGIAAVWFAWVFFAWVMVDRDGGGDAPGVWDWIQNPAMLWRFACAVAEQGWYSIGHTLTPTGIVLWAFWAIEAAIVIGVGFVFAPRHVLTRGFCEDCTQWMADEAPILVPADTGAPGSVLKKHGLGGIQEVEAPSERAGAWLVLGRQRCPQCNESAVYQAVLVKKVKTDKGMKDETSVVLPLSWQQAAERQELARIEQLLAAADAARYAALKSATEPKPLPEQAPPA